MTRVDWRAYIVVDPDVHHGSPVFKGTRIPVATIIGSLADGMAVAAIIQAFPSLTMGDVRAALAYAADIVRQDVMPPG